MDLAELKRLNAQYKKDGEKNLTIALKREMKKKKGGNWFNDTFNKVKNEFVNPDSKLRETIVKPVEDVVKKTKNEFENPDSKLRKEIVPRFDITKTDLSNYPNSAKKTMETLGDLPVESAEIVRTPISKVLSKFINLLSAGKFEQASKDAGYDKLFHLQLVLNVVDKNGNRKKVAIQKTERVQVDGSLTGVTAETEYLSISIGNKNFTPNEMLEKTRKRIGDRDFFGYDSFKNNCQNFILNLLKSEGLAGAKETKFLYQDTKAIADKIPALSKKIMNFTTDAGNVFSKVLGFGNEKRGRGRPKKDVVSMPKKEYLKEHKRLIKVLENAGKEGERQKQEVEHRRIGGMVLKLMEMDRQHKMGGSKANERIIKRHAKMIADEIDAYNKKFGGNWFTDTFNKVKNEFVNPDSKLRQTVVKPIENVVQKIGNEFTNTNSVFRSQILAPVERSFEKFGRDTKEAFEDIGNKIKNEFTNSDSELARAFKPLTDTIGNEDWWKKTMTTPDTYILLITIALDVANMAGVPGAGLASQATKMIGDLAQGRKVSVADLANLALAMIPSPKVPGSQGIFNQIKSQVIGNSGMSAVARSQLIGRNIVKVGKELAGDAKVGFGEMEENGKKYKLHAIVINKKNFDKNDAVVEASKYGSKKGMFMRETKQSFRFRNIPKTKFIPKSYRTKKIGKNGVSLIYGELK
jgi:hypothetical protein